MNEEVSFVVSNNAAKINEGQWRWGVSVEPSQGNANISIDRVNLNLHSTFSPSTVPMKRCQNQRFECNDFFGWGTFVVLVDVFLNEEGGQRRVRLEHLLDFSHGGATTHHTIPVSRPRNSRKDVVKLLAGRPPVDGPIDVRFWHGRGYAGSSMALPVVTWRSQEKPRDDHDATPDWLTASEYCDAKDVLQCKVRQLKTLLQISRNTIIYSGAGISSAAGIAQAARGARMSKNLSTTAQPTFTHKALTALAECGYIQGGWVQQNHDGLPQKAGFPQERINEIHGSWYDPSNPVVLYSGALKRDECKWMEQQARDADLVLVVGTSLGGLNADQVAHQAAHRSTTGRSLGTVIINLQQTVHDGDTTLRIFGETDKVLSELLNEMNIELPKPTCTPVTSARRVVVPYDEQGNLSASVRTWWDLNTGAAVKLVDGHNVVGAGQPLHCSIRKGVGTVSSWKASTMGIHLQIDDVPMCLGQWWIDAAVRGGPKKLPVVNLHPQIVP